MINNITSVGFNRACVMASLGVFTLWGSLGEAEAAAQSNVRHIDVSQLSGDISKFNIFENSQPTSQTRIIKSSRYSEGDTKFSAEYAWVNNHIEAFMDKLSSDFMPEYSEELLLLADEVLKNNPKAFK